MNGFVDEYMPPKVPGYPCASVPRFKTTIQVASSGKENRNQEWEHPLHRFTLPEAGGRDWPVVEALLAHWRIMRGPARTWPWRDPMDFASCGLKLPDIVPDYAATDQVIGTADGFTDRFQLQKRYVVGSESYVRPIRLPVVDSVLVAIDGVLIPDTDYEVSRRGGEVHFFVPPDPPGAGVITAGFLFDVEVRFENDDAMELILRTYAIGGFADISMIEVPPC